MSWEEQEDTTIYKVVVNHEEQYSIWPAHRDNPLGWKDVGKAGPKAECLAYIKEVWTDMRPLSLRKQMEEAARRAAEAGDTAASEEAKPADDRDDLVKRLSVGDHPVEVSIRPQRTAQALRECIERGYVHIKFTGTRGGTELGVRLDAAATDASRVDFDRQTGVVHIVGGLTLNYVKVRCVADIDLATLAGVGHLEPVQQ